MKDAEREHRRGDPVNDKYMLVYPKSGGRPQVRKCDNLLQWAEWFENAERHVAKTTMTKLGTPIEVSTVFLGLDHRMGGPGKPLLFETLVFGGPMDGHMDRCCTWQEAEEQHIKTLEILKENDWKIVELQEGEKHV